MLYNTHPLATITINDETTINIHETIEDKFLLKWDDNVVNEWTEQYDTLSQALTRAAVLAACGETGWNAGFATTEPEVFATKAEQFLHNQIV